jgi:hypothetical protein
MGLNNNDKINKFNMKKIKNIKIEIAIKKCTRLSILFYKTIFI